MNRRKSKKVLIGLGSTVAFGSVGLVAGVGIKSIVEANIFNDNQFNLAQVKSVEEIPKFNTADDKLFPIDTSKFAREVHFGNTWRGQTLTPWGWLGVGNGNNDTKSTIFLTGWNGEILWVNEYDKNLEGVNRHTKNHVYDMKYDFNTDLLFVVRSINPNGLSKPNEGSKFRIDVIKGSTGQNQFSSILPWSQISSFATKAQNFINANFEAKNTDHLFTLDVISSNHDPNTVYLTYSPNFMQLVEKKSTNNDKRQIVSMETILSNWSEFQLTMRLNVNSGKLDILNQTWGGDTNSGGNPSYRDILYKNSSGTWEYKYYDEKNNGSEKKWYASEGSLLTNPFNTISAEGHLITHFIFADNKGNTFHLYYANKNTGNANWTKYVGSEMLAKEGKPNETDVKGVNIPVLNEENKFYWSNIIRWQSKAILSANTRINRNMFEPNSVTFAYPYAASHTSAKEVIPAFNVASIMIDYKTGKIKTSDFAKPFLKSVVYPFGKQAFEYWEKNNSSYSSNRDLQEVYPWPDSPDDPNWLVKFNRLISVSPFDNTIIFASTSPFRAQNDIKLNNANKDKYGSFWVGTSQLLFKDSFPVIRPFLVSNSSGSTMNKKPISPNMISSSPGVLESLYNQGFTFDLPSLNVNPDGTNTRLNLYFNHTGKTRNDVYKYKGDNGSTLETAPMRTSKIGLLDSPFYNDKDAGNFKNSWATGVDEIYGTNGFIPYYTAEISDVNFSSLIHSRAKIDDWWKRSWFNVNNAANTLKADGSQINPSYKTDDDHPVAYAYGKNLKNPILKGAASAELLSNWKTGGANFDRLAVKQGSLKIIKKSEKNKLFVELSFNPDTSIVNSKYSPIFNSDPKRQRLFWKKEFEIYNPSYQIFTSWSEHTKVSGLTTGTSSLVASFDWNNTNITDWIDARQDPNLASFGKSNNALIVDKNNDNKIALRPVFRIKNPVINNKPQWWNPDDKFFQWYPVDSKDILNGETLFKDILIQFVEWKNKNINLNYGATKSQGLGLANLTIEASLQLNPKINLDASLQNYPIYKIKDNRFLILDNNNSSSIRMVIYEDLYKGNHTVYKQEETDYLNLNKSGFKSEELKDSWTSSGLQGMKVSNLKVETKISDLKDEMVRPSANYKDPVIKAKYTDKNKTQVKIELASQDQKGWFDNVFNSYNFALNLFVRFEYSTKSEPNKWIPFEGSDKKNYVVDKSNASDTGWTFNTSAKDIIKVRYRLIESPTKGQYKPDSNDFVEWKDFNENDLRLISTEVAIQDKFINFESSWVTSEQLILANNATLEKIQTSDVTSYEKKIIQKIAKGNPNNPDLNNDRLNEILEFQYFINSNNTQGMIYLSSDQLVSKLKELLNSRTASDDGAFSLWNDNKSDKTKIHIKIGVKEKYKNQYVLIENNTEEPNGIGKTVRANIKTKIDLSKYFEWLKNQKLVASKIAEGQMNNIKIQTSNFGAGLQFSNRTFEQMKLILDNVGIKFLFKQWDSKTNNWSTSWVEDLSAINQYDVKNPAIMIGLKFDTNFNIELWVENKDISTTVSSWPGIEVKLQLPKTVKVDINKIKEEFNKQPAITGDTHQIDITKVDGFIQERISDIIQVNNGNNNNFDDLRDKLQFKFKLGSSNWEEINSLSNWVNQQNKNKVDFTSNLLAIKIELNDANKTNEFEFAENTQLDINLYDEDNDKIKKWIHGIQYENALESISVAGDKTNITYNYPEELNKIITHAIDTLVVQWADATINNNRADDWKDVSDVQPPTDVNNGTIKKIKFKVSLNTTKNTFLYGPEELKNQKIKEIDLTNLKTLVQVDSNWFKQNLVVPNGTIKINDSSLITKLNDWENKVLSQIKNTDNEVVKKIKIKFDFTNSFINLTAQQLVEKIKNKIDENADIVQLWDGNNGTGIKIQAKFFIENNDRNLIQFIDQNDLPIDHDSDQLKGDVNTQNIQTDVNLINYISLLTEKEIEVNPASDSATNLGSINGIKPPRNDRDGLFKNKTWDEISQNLESKKIKIIFSENKATWQSAKDVNHYDPNKGILYLAIENNSTNLNIDYKQGGTSITPNTDSKTDSLIIKLKVTKLINIKESDLEQYLKNPEISGDTKNISINKNPIDAMITQIKTRNANESGNPEFERANIVLKFSLDSSNKGYMDLNAFKKYLSDQKQDQTTRVLRGKFFIENNQDNDWKLSGKEEFTILNEQNNPLKIFIHNENIFENLSKPSISGNNTDLKWNWSNLTVDPNSGIITSPNKNNSLKVEYSSDKNNWSSTQIKSVPAGTNSVWIRLVFTDPNRFVFEVPGNINKEIEVKLDNIKQILSVSTNRLTNIDLSKTEIDIASLSSNVFTTWETDVKNQMTVTNNSINNWKDLIEFEYRLEDKMFPANQWFNSSQLISKLIEWQNNNLGDTLGILQLWNQSTGKKISTRLKLKNANSNYELRVDNISPSAAIKTIKTNNITTTINFVAVFNWLKQIKLDINRISDHEFSDIIWPIVKASGSKFDTKTWDQVVAVLKQFNINVMYQDIDQNDKPKQWQDDYKKMNSFGSNATFNMKFLIKDPIKAKNIKLKISDTETLLPTAKPAESKIIEINLKAPKFIKLDQKIIDDFKKTNVITGNTKYLKIQQNLIDKLIKDIKDNNTNISNIQDANLKISFGMGKKVNANEWFEPSVFANEIQKRTIDQTSNQINMVIWVQNANPNEPDFITDINPIELKKHSDPDQVKLNQDLQYFINDNKWESLFKQIKVFGTTEQLIWNWGNGLDSLINLNANETLIKTNLSANHLGLHFEWTTLESADVNDAAATNNQDLANGWTKIKPEKISNNVNKIWIRAVAQPGFVYGPTQDTSTTPIQKHEIDLKQIKRIVKLNSQWLEKIKATGDLVNLIIDDNAARSELSNNQVLPPDELENLIFEYSIDGNNWKDKDNFQKFLKTNDGKGASGFILKREDIKVRFGLKKTVADNKYGFIIDGKLIQNPESFKDHYKYLIDDIKSINTSVLGVINTKFIPTFEINTFEIFGSNNVPRLNVKKEAVLTSSFMPYISNQIFKIQISTNYNEQSKQWDWNNAKEIWQNGNFIKELSKLQLTIPANKKVAIRLKTSDNTKYKVKNNNTNLEEEKLLDISNNVHITFEIENPFVNANKVLSIWTRDDQRKAKWNQGEGQFRIIISDKNTNAPDLQTDASKFLENSSEPNKDKLELVYKIFETEPTKDEINYFKNPTTINKYDDPQGWKAFEFQKNNTDNYYWSQGLNLKVGNFIMVALRVKKEYGTQRDPFVLKNNQHSVLIPVISDKEKPGRVAGFKIDPDRVPINKSTIQLENSKENLFGGYLDGYTLLKNLTLESDDKFTIEGIKLKLSLFNDFYRDSSNKKILISATGSKLVKREKDGNQGMQYVDSNGNKLVDENGDPIYIYTDPKTNRLTNPIENSPATRSIDLIYLNNGNFIFPVINDEDVLNEYSLFRNQKIEINYEAKEGEKLDGMSDFELTKEKSDDLQDIISPQIKFPVENPANISYFWKHEDFANNILEYESSAEGIAETISGFSKIKTPLEIQRIDNGNPSPVTGVDGKSSVAALEQMLKTDFNDQLEFTYTYLKKSGSQTVTRNSADIYNLEHLENGDKITLTIQAKADDLIYADAPRPLVLNVDGLLTDAPKQERLQFLRVEQRGNLNGEGSFRLLINDPTKPETNESLLKGWKFLIRVWSKDKKSIKINWTEDQTNLVNLENGDKVEWKLVDQNGNPVRDAYYNTVAGDHQQGDDGNIIYKFQQVNYDNGPTSKKVIKDEIGKYPSKNEENKYPESSGFVIGGLKEKILRFDLTQFAFEKIIATLEPRYKGINGHGVLNFNEKFFEGQWWINHDGDVYQKESDAPTTFADNVDQPAEITLDQFFANTTFYTENPATNPLQMGWHFSSNETEVDNYLFNNNQLWARFDVVQPDASGTYQDSDGRFLIAALPQVSNLKIISDEMSPLWWILITLGFIATFGTLFIFYWKQRHKKLKVPKFK